MKDNSVIFLLLFFTVIIYIFYQIKYVDIVKPVPVYINRPQPIYIPYHTNRPRRNRIQPRPPKRPSRPKKVIQPMPRPDIQK